MRVICSAVAPCRLRTKQSLWVYLSLALKTQASGQYRFEPGQLKCSKKGLPSVNEPQPTFVASAADRGFMFSDKSNNFGVRCSRAWLQLCHR